MRLFLPLLVLALAGCESFREGAGFTDERAVYNVDGKAYAVRTQFDALEYAYFTQVKAAEIGPPLTMKDTKTVVGIVTNEVGAVVCDGRKMLLSEFNDQNLPGGGNVIFLRDRGVFQIVTRCELDFPDFFPEAIGLPDNPSADFLPDADEIIIKF